jgi:hypothetical protein
MSITCIEMIEQTLNKGYTTVMQISKKGYGTIEEGQKIRRGKECL